MKRVLFILLALVLALSVGLIGCEGEEGEGEPEPGGTLRVVCQVTPGNVGFPLECKREAGFYHHPGIQALMKPATDYWTTGNIEPFLATSWSSANDATEWTFELRTGVKFHDGTDWNASACEWNIELVNDYEGGRSTFKDVTSIDILGEHTVKLTFETPYVGLIADMFDSLYCISPTAFEENVPDPEAEEPDISWFDTHLVGTGPFELTSVEYDVYTWEPFDDYWGDAPLLDKIEVHVIPESSTCKAMLLAGDAELYVHADPQAVRDLVLSGGFSARYNDELAKLGVFPSATNTSSIYADIEVRQALEYAINRTAVAQVLSAGGVPYEAEYQLPMDWDSAYDGAHDVELYNPSQAIALLESAIGTGAGLDGEYFETTCYVESGDDVFNQIALVVESYLEAVNITVDIQYVDGRDFRDWLTELGWGNDNLAIAGYSWSPIPYSSTLNWFNPYSSRRMCETVLTEDMIDIWEDMNVTYDLSTLQTLHEDMMQETRDESLGVFITNEVKAAVYADTLHTTWMLPYDRLWRCNLDWLA